MSSFHPFQLNQLACKLNNINSNGSGNGNGIYTYSYSNSNSNNDENGINSHTSLNFPNFFLTTAKVASMTAVIYFVSLNFSKVLIGITPIIMTKKKKMSLEAIIMIIN